MLEDVQRMGLNVLYMLGTLQVGIQNRFISICFLKFLGKITCNRFLFIIDVNIWNRALSVDEMLGWTNCRQVINFLKIFNLI